MIDQILKDAKPKMESSIDNLKESLSKIRTGRANAGILDGVKVSYYGTPTSIKELATISTPEPNMITVKPWDKNALNDIETGIRNSDLGISPVNDGVQIRLVLPQMTEERRKEIASQVKNYGEQAKIALRNIRSEAWSEVQSAVKKNEATEDDKYQAEENLNKMIDEMNKEVDRVISDKESEILKI